MQPAHTNHPTSDSTDAASESSTLMLSPPISPKHASTDSQVVKRKSRSEAWNHFETDSQVVKHKSRSEAWNHFEKAPDYDSSRKATCMHCNKTGVASCGSTTALLTHLRKDHPGVFASPPNG
jgi:hypothetical protein